MITCSYYPYRLMRVSFADAVEAEVDDLIERGELDAGDAASYYDWRMDELEGEYANLEYDRIREEYYYDYDA